ncbi:hypothetical protein ABIF69_005747 [Bradyrhizobium japonicum]
MSRRADDELLTMPVQLRVGAEGLGPGQTHALPQQSLVDHQV